MKKKVYLYNTFNTVVPVMRLIAEVLRGLGYEPKGLVLKKAYRFEKKEGPFFQQVDLPAFLQGSKFLASLSYSVVAVYHAMFKSHALGILFTHPPLLYILLSWIFRVRKIPYLIHHMDLHPEMLFQLNYLKKNSLLGRVLSAMAIRSINGARTNVAIGHCMRDRLIALGASSNIKVIHVLTSEDEISSFKSKEGVQEDQEKLILSYIGNCGRIHSITEIQDLLMQVKRAGLQELVQINFVSQGGKTEKLKAFCKENNISAVVFHQYLKSVTFNQLIDRSHFLLITMGEGFAGISVPSKLWTNLAKGKRTLFIGPDQSDIARIVKENNVGATFAPRDMHFAPFIMRLLQDTKHLPAKSEKRIADLYQDQFASIKFKQRYRQLLKGCLYE